MTKEKIVMQDAIQIGNALTKRKDTRVKLEK